MSPKKSKIKNKIKIKPTPLNAEIKLEKFFVLIKNINDKTVIKKIR